jgi:hypothetical protein
MTRLHDALERLVSERQSRGSAAVLAGARDEAAATGSRRRFATLAATAATVVLLVVGAVVWALPGSDNDPVQSGPGSTSSTTTDPDGTTTSTSPTTSTPPPIDGNVDVFFSIDTGADCAQVAAAPREVEGSGVLAGALDELVGGPTPAEQADGLSSSFSAATADVVQSVSVANGTAHIDFEDFVDRMNNASTSCGSTALLAQLDATARQFPTVARTIYSFDGDPAAFYTWLQRESPEPAPSWGGQVSVDPESGAMSADGFTVFVAEERPGWALDAREAAVVLLDLGAQPRDDGRTVRVTEQAGEGDEVIVTVTELSLPDDSVESIRSVVTFSPTPAQDDPTFLEGSLRFLTGTQTFRCQPGRGHQSFSTELCT